MNAVARESGSEPAPVRLRPATDAAIGTTAFFRNRALLNVLLGRIATLETMHVSVLVHGCSIGAEVWSLLVAAALDPRTRQKHIHVSAYDLEPGFVAYAQQAVYPRAVLAGMSADEQAYFDLLDANAVRVNEALQSHASFLPAQSVAEFTTRERFDVELLLNVLLYLPGELQSRTIDTIAGHNSTLLVTTGFHLDRIKADMQRNAYRPVGEAASAIHDGWTDRRRNGPSRDETVPGKIYHAWSLPAFSEIEDFEYKYCAIFEKQSL